MTETPAVNGTGDRRLAGDPEFVYRLFDEMPLMVIAMDGPQHRIAALTGVYRQFIGRDDAVGVPLLETFPELLGQRVSAIFDRVFATGQPESVRDFRIHFDHPATAEPMEIFLDFDATARRGPTSEVTGVIVHVQDVTARMRERQAAQAQVAEAQLRYEQARDVVDALQRELLPAGLPVLPGVEVAASYLLAEQDSAAGGDWFDAVAVPGARVALVVGDVVGHGVRASAAMGQLRAVVQDRLAESGDLSAAMAAADRTAAHTPGARAATVCLVLLDPADGTLSWCAAGHPPPLIAGPHGARFLPASGQGPLGSDAVYRVRSERLEKDEVVLLYSDGIIERPGREPAAATAELSAVVSDVVEGRGFHGDAGTPIVEKACTETLELLVRQTGNTDDITLLAARRRPPVPALHLHQTAATAVRAARRAVADWLSDLQAGEYDRTALVHAVVELVTNAGEHARPDAVDTTVTVTGQLDDTGTATISVADNGQWRERARPGDDAFREDHGLGLPMAAGFTDRLEVERGADGTTVTVWRRLTRSAQLLTSDQITSGVARTGTGQPAELMLIVDQPNAPSSRIAIHGPLDADTVPHLRAELDRYTLGGTHDVIVDLTAVTRLASAAVAEFYRLAPGRERRFPLRLYAPAGSVAQQVLHLVDLPHSTDDPHLAT